MPKPLITVVCALALANSASLAQAPRYSPTNANPNGPELVMTYISSSWCIGNRAPGLHEAVDSLKLLLANWAHQHDMTFRAVGVALDWQPDSGLVYLAEFGKFDELNVGSNWFNLSAATFIWGDTSSAPSIPQVLVYRHDISSTKNRVTVGKPVLLKRVQGGDQVVAWARSGAPLQ